MSDDWKTGGFGLYIHWPFCEAKCPYCDFNSHVAQSVNQRRWTRAYCSSISQFALEFPHRTLNAIFFGGGTPSLMSSNTIEEILSHISKNWKFSPNIEITLEANPTSIEAEKFKNFHAAGINRISIGIQALNNYDLRRLGRRHNVKDALNALEIAQNLFPSVSFDLIYARQHQTINQWTNELKQALSLGIDHVSLYQLTIEENTAFGDRYQADKLNGLPNEAIAADMYLVTQNTCEEAGLVRYEISNHAKPGAESKHNLIYWCYGDYVGIGPGAHGRLTLNDVRYATEAKKMPDDWLSAIETGIDHTIRMPLSSLEQAYEYLLLGLRIREGIDQKRYALLAGKKLSEIKIEKLTNLGLITNIKDRISVTNQGLLVLNSIVKNLL
ncbi:MAG: radical SAM family heme chaperone HemW [Aestuariivita sp.]|nr:radical SAM family heme chaperone HemW [Aestuariivita sp.]